MATLAERMMALFESNHRSRGVYHKTGKVQTEREPYTLTHFENHVAGHIGLGLVPIDELNLCKWGAIDVDCHGKDPIDIPALWNKVNEAGYPLVVCRSKSGGAHLYLFVETAIEAKTMRAVLRLFSERLGYSNAEVFPKQSSLIGPDALGNWINLPYFHAEETVRWCYVNGQASFEYFIETAEGSRVSLKVLEEVLTGDHAEAPPCVQQMLSGKVPAGYRNEALFGISVYMKRAFPDTWKDKVSDANVLTFDEPLEAREVRTIVNSVAKREYRYRCREEPCKAFCNASACVKRKFGIDERDDPTQADKLGIQEFVIEEITKVMTEPPIYRIKACGRVVKVTAGVLHNPAAMAVSMMEQADVIIHPVKPKDWLGLLAAAMLALKLELAPDDASPGGLVRERLREFLAKAYDNDNKEKAMQYLLHGQPVKTVDDDGKDCVVFKGSAFVEYLKRTKSMDMRGSDLWQALREAGVQYCRLRVGGKPTNLWRAPYDEPARMEAPDTRGEF